MSMTDIQVARAHLAVDHACGLWVGLLGVKRSSLVRAARLRALAALDAGDATSAVSAMADMAVYALNAVQSATSSVYLGSAFTDEGVLPIPADEFQAVQAEGGVNVLA